MNAPPKNVSEAQFQAQIIDVAQRLGWQVFHVSDSRREVRGRNVSFLVGDKLARGWPDLTLAHPRWRMFGVRELKTNTGRLTPVQRRWLETLAVVGVDALIWRPRDWDDLIVPYLTGKQRRNALEAIA